MTAILFSEVTNALLMALEIDLSEFALVLHIRPHITVFTTGNVKCHWHVE